MNPLVELVGFLGGAIGLAISAPQIVRIIRSRSQVGVSLFSWLVYTLSVSSWAAWGFRNHSPSQVVTNFIAACLTGYLAWLLLRTRLKGKVPLPAFSAALVLLVLVSACEVLITTEPEPIVDVILALFLTSRVPQVVTSYRSFRLARRTVVSLTTYVMSGLSAVCWILYGILSGVLVITIFSAVVLGLSILILVFELLAIKRADALDASALSGEKSSSI
jgi:uncharacterized protein with PQ loop repeat